LQAACLRLIRDLEETKRELDVRPYEVFVDLGLRILSREAIDIELDEWRQAA
jgi:hypothetical protein